MIIISEIIINIIGLAYKTRNYSILKSLLNTSVNNSGIQSRIIFDTRIWHPYLFNHNVVNYITYLFPKDVEKDLFSALDLQYLVEVVFLFDCYSKSLEYPNTCYPIFLIYENYDAPKQITSRLLSEDQDLINCIKEVFSINDVNYFLKLVLKRLSELSDWSSSSLHGHGYYLNPIIKTIEEHLSN